MEGYLAQAEKILDVTSGKHCLPFQLSASDSRLLLLWSYFTAKLWDECKIIPVHRCAYNIPKGGATDPSTPGGEKLGCNNPLFHADSWHLVTSPGY